MKSFAQCRFFAACVVGLCGVTFTANSSQAQMSLGFETTLKVLATGQESNAQSDFWALEISFKPMRMITVGITDPKTGKSKREFIWYLVYKAVNREIERRKDDSDTTPVNDEDPQPVSLFVPEFTLVTDDNGVQKSYADSILPEAQAAIIERERLVLKNSVELAGPIPPVTPQDATKENAIYGVVTWRGIDPRTDEFTVYMTGFSNGYRVSKGPDGQPLIQRRTIVQQFWRPGDRFDQDEIEFRQQDKQGRAYEPHWIYRPDELTETTAKGKE